MFLYREHVVAVSLADTATRKFVELGRTGGSPTRAVMSSAGGEGSEHLGMVVADPAHAAIIAVSAGSGTTGGGVAVVADSYEGTPFSGPSALACCPLPSGGEMLAFCDAGASGDTSIDSPTGSVYVIVPDTGSSDGGSVLRPICTGCLADPVDVALLAPPAGAPSADAASGVSMESQVDAGSKAGSLAPIGFVAERGAGRLWRFAESPAGSGAFRMSVFASVSGGTGPCALAVDARAGPGFGTVFVGVGEEVAACALLRAGGVAADGACARVVAYSPGGKQIGEWAVPQLSTVTGMCMDPSGAYLLVSGVPAWLKGDTEQSASGGGLIVRIAL